MKANIYCPTIKDMRAKLLELCEQKGINATEVYAPGTEKGDNRYGMLFATDANGNVKMATPFWRSDDGIYMMQSDLIPAPQLKVISYNQ